jgi:hypothetical protein
MISRTILVSIMGISALIPASATISYQSSQPTFVIQAGTDSLAVSSLVTFTGALSTLVTTNDQYIDPLTNLEFLAFNSGGTPISFASITGNTLIASGGSQVEIVFPAGIDFGFAFNFTTGTFLTLCEDTTPSGCSGSAFVISPASGFIGAISDTPTNTPLTALWLHAQSGSATINIQSFEVATQNVASTPDGPTWLLIGSGLIVLPLLHRRRRAPSEL